MQFTRVAIHLAKRSAYALAAVAFRISLSAAQEVDGEALRLTEASEGCLLTAYRDPVGVLTIGWGHTGHDVYEGMVITRAQAEELLRQDMIIAEMCVNHDVKVPLTQNQFDALVDLTFNIGGPNFANSTLLRKLNARDYVGAAAEFSRWNQSKGVVLEGLVERRAAEAELFLRPDTTISLSASGSDDVSLKLLIQRTILEDFEDCGPIWAALKEILAT